MATYFNQCCHKFRPMASRRTMYPMQLVTTEWHLLCSRLCVLFIWSHLNAQRTFIDKKCKWKCVLAPNRGCSIVSTNVHMRIRLPLMCATDAKPYFVWIYKWFIYGQTVRHCKRNVYSPLNVCGWPRRPDVNPKARSTLLSWNRKLNRLRHSYSLESLSNQS